jgi:DNA-binding Xre family transcriptional regulator
MKKKDLEKAANLTHYQMMKLANNQTVTTDVLGSICKVFNCRIEDIMEFIQDERETK